MPACIVIDGQAPRHALARMPSATDHRGNLAAGGTGVVRPLNDRDRELVAGIGPALAARGMVFVGLDVIGGFVTEINVTSPTGVREIDEAGRASISPSRCSTPSTAGSRRGNASRCRPRSPFRSNRRCAPRAGDRIAARARSRATGSSRCACSRPCCMDC